MDNVCREGEGICAVSCNLFNNFEVDTVYVIYYFLQYIFQ